MRARSGDGPAYQERALDGTCEMNAKHLFLGAFATVVALGVAVGNLAETSAVASPSRLAVTANDAASLQASIDTIVANNDELVSQLGAMRAELRGIKVEFDNLGQRLNSVTNLQDGMAKLLHGEIVAIASELEEVSLRLNTHGAGEMMRFARLEAFNPAAIETAAIPSGPRVRSHALGVGESVNVEGRNVFVSYLTGSDGVLFIDRSQRTQVGGGYGALAMDNGCDVTLNGVQDGKAMIKTVCE